MHGWLLLLLASSSATLTLACAAFAWRLRPHPAARAFSLYMLTQSVCGMGYVAELLSDGVQAKLLWDNIQYVAWLGFSPTMLWFAWEYAQCVPPRLSRLLGYVMVIPVATVIWVLTDPLHGHARASAHVVPSPPFDMLIYDFGFLDLLFSVQMYLIALYVVVIVGRAAVEHPRGLRAQALLVMFGLALPMAGNLIGLLDPELFGQRDVSPICFGIGAVPITWALQRGRFLNLVPIARHVVFEQVPDPVLVIDAHERVVDLNPAAKALFGSHVQLGTQASSVLPTWSAKSIAVGSSNTEYSVDVRGRAFDVSVRRLASGGRVALLRDVTERRRAERELLEAQEVLEQRVRERTSELHARIAEKEEAERATLASERRFKLLVDGATQLMATLSADGTLTGVNRSALEFAGTTEVSVLGKPLWETPWWSHSSELQGRLQEAIRRAARGEHVQMEVTQLDRAGQPHPFDFSLKPLWFEDQDVLLLAEARDMTEHERAERERAMLREQLHHSQRVDSIGRLAGGIAHDFNNLLTVILGHIELARMDMARGKSNPQHLEHATVAGESAAGLTRQLLMFARRQPTDPRVLDLNEVVRQTHSMLRRLIREDIQLRLELIPTPLHVFADVTQLEQVLINLAVNARDAMEAGGVLTISTGQVASGEPLPEVPGARQTPYGHVKLSIRDTGVGMSPTVMQHMFEPFFTTKGSGKGTGIGLATVDNVVRESGGFITVHSAPGAGTQFEIYLPASSEPLGSLRRRETDIPVGTERVALVEDQPAVRELAEEQLHQLGYQVRTYASAEEAFRALRQDLSRVDLLITDIVLQGESGGALVERLRAVRPSLPVLYMSGYADEMVFGRGVDVRNAPLLHKPFSLKALAQSVRRALAS
ncbi:MAG: histidine kinase N-terminal 7TM domain-containing protein [Myxococcales bacterium]